MTLVAEASDVALRAEAGLDTGLAADRRGSFHDLMDLRHAGRRPVRIAYELQGPENAPVVIVAGGISAGRHVAASAAFAEPGWWDALVGPGQALDTKQVRVLAIDWLGADGTLDVPIDAADQADAIARVLGVLGIARAAAFIGCSYGAMVGLQFASRYPSAVGCLLAVSGGHRAHPFASAWRGLQRRIVQLGRSDGGSREALSLARQLAMLSYRTPGEFAERFVVQASVHEGRVHCAADDYLVACGARFVARHSPTAFVRLSESIDLHCIDPASVPVPTTLIGVHEDALVPADAMIELATRLPRLRRLHLLHSRYGHDAFLKEPCAIGEIISETLATTGTLQATGVAA